MSESPDWMWWLTTYGGMALAFILGLVLGNMTGFSRGLLKGFNIAKGSHESE